MTTETTDDGGPAFPHDGQANYTGGMSLRDYFAGRAMQAMIPQYFNDGPLSIRDTADEAYAFADAMLAARKERP